MSAKVDRERREASAARRIDEANETIRLEVEVLRFFCEGLSFTKTAERIGCSRKTAWLLRGWLGLTEGGEPRSRRAMIEEAERRIRFDRSVVAAAVDGFKPTDAERVGIWLGLETGKRHRATGKRTGDLYSKQALQRVRP